MPNINLPAVDWKLLRKQKEWLVELLACESIDPAGRMLGSGLVHLLDDIQDQAAEQLGEDEVFECPICEYRSDDKI